LKPKRIKKSVRLNLIRENKDKSIYAIQEIFKSHGFKVPHHNTIAKILGNVKLEDKIKEAKQKRIESKPHKEKKPCRYKQPEDAPFEYVIEHGDYSCPNCYNSFRGNQLVRSEGAVFTRTKYPEARYYCPYCEFLIGTVSDFKTVWDKKHKRAI